MRVRCPFLAAKHRLADCICNGKNGDTMKTKAQDDIKAKDDIAECARLVIKEMRARGYIVRSAIVEVWDVNSKQIGIEVVIDMPKAAKP